MDNFTNIMKALQGAAHEYQVGRTSNAEMASWTIATILGFRTSSVYDFIIKMAAEADEQGELAEDIMTWDPLVLINRIDILEKTT